MKAVKKDRESNFELLRIILMLMIIVYHIFCHAVNPQLAVGNEIFNLPVIYKKLFILSVFSPLGKIGDEVFILISGYFLFEKSKNIELGKVGKKLITQLVFSTIVLSIASILIFKLTNYANINLMTFDNVNGISWFIGYYFVIIISAKLFLNNYLEKASKKKYLDFLIVLFCVIQFSFFRNFIGDISTAITTYLTGIFLYSLGGYIRKYNPFSDVKTIGFIIIILLSSAFVILSTYGNTYNNILNFTRNGSVGIFQQSIQLYEDSNFIPIIIGISLFELFRRIKIKNNKIINFISRGTLMVYLLHDNPLVYSLWNYINWIDILCENPFKYFCIHIGFSILTFIIAFVGYLVYLLINKLVYKYKGLIIKKV